MHMRNWNLVVLSGLTIAGVGLSSNALAGGEGKHAGSFIDHEMKMADTNSDQKLSVDEHAMGARKMFETMDANKDGNVTAEEMVASHEQVAGHKAKKTDMSAAEKIKVCDTNNDGVLSAEEHANGAKMMFGKMDTNKDGQLTKAELASGHAKMMQGHGKMMHKTEK